MTRSIQLPADILNQLEEIRIALELSQKELANQAHISHGSVSNFFAGRRMRADYVGLILEQLSAALSRRRASNPGFAEELRDLPSALEKARALVQSHPKPKRYMARPGGAVPPNAENRIRRPEDEQLLRGLDDAPASMVVRGPPQSGKTTLLLALQEAAERRGFATVLYDCGLIGSKPNNDIDKLRQNIYTDFIQEHVAPAIGEKRPPNFMEPGTLISWLQKVRYHKPDPPLLLMMDDLSALKDPVAEEWYQICRTLHNLRFRTQITWVLTLTVPNPGKDPDKNIWFQSEHAFHPRVEVAGFNTTIIEELLKSYNLKEGPGLKKTLLDILGKTLKGNPFWCHTLVDAMAEIKNNISKEIDISSEQGSEQFHKRADSLIKKITDTANTPEDSSDFQNKFLKTIQDFSQGASKDNANLAHPS